MRNSLRRQGWTDNPAHLEDQPIQQQTNESFFVKKVFLAKTGIRAKGSCRVGSRGEFFVS